MSMYSRTDDLRRIDRDIRDVKTDIRDSEKDVDLLTREIEDLQNLIKVARVLDNKQALRMMLKDQLEIRCSEVDYLKELKDDLAELEDEREDMREDNDD